MEVRARLLIVVQAIGVSVRASVMVVLPLGIMAPAVLEGRVVPVPIRLLRVQVAGVDSVEVIPAASAEAASVAEAVPEAALAEVAEADSADIVKMDISKL